MRTINKLIIVLFLILNFGSFLLQKIIFLKKEKINMMNKNMKNLNFCFKEVLFLIPKDQRFIFVFSKNL